MRVLRDENLPHDLVRELTAHDVSTVQGRGWAGVSNGELFKRAAGEIDVLLTMDLNLEYQQNVSASSVAVIVIHAKSNRIVDLKPLAGALLDALTKIQPGLVVHVGGPSQRT